MRILLISDIHGNLAALEAVLAEPHDAIVCLGDLVGYGPEPGACVRRILDSAAVVLLGNHDHSLLEGVAPGCRPEFRRLADATAGLARAQLDRDEMNRLGGLPRWAYPDIDALRCLCVHATPSNPLYRYLGPDVPAWAREVAGLDVQLLLVGHTHLPFDFVVGGVRVVNPGSVGQPKDGDPRAAYAVIERGRIELKRVAYPIERTVSDLRATAIERDVVEALAFILQTGRTPAAASALGDRNVGRG